MITFCKKYAGWAFAYMMISLTFFVAEASAVQNRTKLRKTVIGHKTVLYGQASFYAAKFQGRRTASGQLFDHAALTAACNTLPLGTWVKVTNLKNGKTVVVRTNDRLHVKTGRLIDLTRAAATRLGFVKAGLTRVKIEVLPAKNNK